MEIKIFFNGEELKQEVSNPSRINELMDELSKTFPNIIENANVLSSLKITTYDG